MQIIEVKNNLVRVNYNASQDNLILSGFVLIKDENLSFIAQIMHLEANAKGSFAILKLIFTFDDEGVLNNYNGSIPNPKCEVEAIDSKDLLALLAAENPINIGELAQQKTLLTLDRTLLEENLLVCCEKTQNGEILIRNMASQLVASGKKVFVIDLEGEISQNKIVASEDFKLPLNYNSINFIYEKGLDDAKAESKALIQDIFLEVQLYVKTLREKFIPFDSFKAVVDEQYKTLGLVELVLLKNKLLKFYEAGIFAGQKNEFEILETSLKQNQITVLDLSKTEPAIQREMISYAYSLMNSMGEKIYTIVNLNSANSDKKLLKQIFQTKNAYSTIVCPYAYKYLIELKQIAKNLIMFAPIQQQQDFASYSAFLSKLNPDEFIIYGKATHNMPLIVKLDENLPPVSQNAPVAVEEPVVVEETPIFEKEEFKVEDFHEDLQEDLLNEEINQDVDSFYTAPQTEEVQQEPVSEDVLTEDDLDFIEALNSSPDADSDQEPDAYDDLFSQEEEQEVVIDEPIEIHENLAEESPIIDILPAGDSNSSISSIPIYSAEIPAKEGAESQEFEQGDTVTHVKYGKGVVEKLINYGSKTLCSIQFDNVGRRLLDPSLAEIKKI